MWVYLCLNDWDLIQNCYLMSYKQLLPLNSVTDLDYCIQKWISCISTQGKRASSNRCCLNSKHPSSSICNVDVCVRVLTLYWIVFLIVSFVPRSKENRLCLKSIGSANDPWSAATLGLPEQQIESQMGQLLGPALIASTNIFLKEAVLEFRFASRILRIQRTIRVDSKEAPFLLCI